MIKGAKKKGFLQGKCTLTGLEALRGVSCTQNGNRRRTKRKVTIEME